MRAGLCGLLGTLGPRVVVHSESGRVGIRRALESARWDVLIVDLECLDGLEFLLLDVVQCERAPRRIILLSNYESLLLSPAVLASCADAKLCLRSAPSQLIPLLRRLLAEPGAGSGVPADSRPQQPTT